MCVYGSYLLYFYIKRNIYNVIHIILGVFDVLLNITFIITFFGNYRDLIDLVRLNYLDTLQNITFIKQSLF